MKFWNYISRAVVSLTIVYFLYLTLFQVGLGSSIPLGRFDFIFIIQSLFLYMIAMFSGSMVWHLLLTCLGVSIERKVVAGIVFLSQPGKYLPGNVAHHVGRFYLAGKNGIASEKAIFSMIMELVLVTGSAALLSLIVVDNSLRDQLSDVISLPGSVYFFLGGLLAFLLALCGYKLFGYSSQRFARSKGVNDAEILLPSFGTYLKALTLYLINFSLLGLILFLVVSRIFLVNGGGVLLFTGIFSVAWVVGFLMPGASAGIGVREAILIHALVPLMGYESAVGASAVMRIITILGDGLAYLVGSLLLALDRT